MLCQRLNTKNDVNGNPRRIWILYNKDGGIMAVIDEGYGGKPEITRGMVELPDYDVTIKQYKFMLDWYRSKTAEYEKRAPTIRVCRHCGWETARVSTRCLHCGEPDDNEEAHINP